MVVLHQNLEPDIWLRYNRGIYEYISVYYDNLSAMVRYPNRIICVPKNRYKLNPKGVVTIEFNLGCHLFRARNDILFFSPHKYIDNMVQTYMTIFGSKSIIKNAIRNPLEHGDHPYIGTL